LKHTIPKNGPATGEKTALFELQIFISVTTFAFQRFLTSGPLNSRFLSRVVSIETSPDVVPSGGTPDKLFQKINIELKGHDKAVLKSYTTVLKAAATNLDIPSGDMCVFHCTVYLSL